MAAERMIHFSFGQQRSELLDMGSMMYGAGRARDMLLHIGKLRQLPKCWSIRALLYNFSETMGATVKLGA